MHTELVGPKTTTAVLKYAQWEGVVGNGHKGMDRSVKKLFANDGFDLRGATRMQKFTRTVSAFSKGGACTGALLGTGLMAIPDAITGRGRLRHDEPDHFMDQGILGRMTWGLTTGVSVAAEGVGAGTGAVLGAVNPGALSYDKSYPAWVKKHCRGGQKAFGTFTAGVLGGTLGTALTIARLPSLFVKYTLAGAFAIPSAVVGFLGGSIRAVIDK